MANPVTMTPPEVPVQVAVAHVMQELQGIGKTGRNKEQGYNFRGIDAVLQALHPLLAKHGVLITPEVIERLYEERISGRGTTGHCAHLHVQYTVRGPVGDSFTISTWGEGLDYSDKATNKAMTAAFKYALFELFAICDPSEDADTETLDGGSNTGHSPVTSEDRKASEAARKVEEEPQYTALQNEVRNHPNLAKMKPEERAAFVTDAIGYENPGLRQLSDEDCEKILFRLTA